MLIALLGRDNSSHNHASTRVYTPWGHPWAQAHKPTDNER